VTPGARQPQALAGGPLGATGLRLLVADTPPLVLDVDTGRTTRVRRIPTPHLSYVVGLPGGGGVVVVRRTYPSAELYAVRGPAARVTRLASGWAVAPDADGRSVWIKSIAGRPRCTLRRVALDGRVIRGPRPFPCTRTVEAGSELGLVVHGTALYDPVTAETTLRPRPGIVAAVGTYLVLVGPRPAFDEPDKPDTLTLLDAATGRRKTLPWPSVIPRGTQTGLDSPAVDPRGRYVALGFGDPAWHMTGNQVTDVWILDTTTGKLTHLPGTPAFVSLKRTSMAWTADGRLVLLGHDDSGDFVAVWRPGAQRLALKRIDLGERSGGSDSFAVLSR
jgi:hypothetical protein